MEKKNLQRVKEILLKDELVSKASVLVKEAKSLGFDDDEYYCYVSGVEEACKKAEELVKEEINESKDKDRKIIRAFTYISKALSTWFNEVGLKKDSHEMAKLIQREKGYWVKALEGNVLNKIDDGKILKKVEGWGFQSAAEIHSRKQEWEKAIETWDRAKQSFFEGKDMYIALDMVLNILTQVRFINGCTDSQGENIEHTIEKKSCPNRGD